MDYFSSQYDDYRLEGAIGEIPAPCQGRRADFQDSERRPSFTLLSISVLLPSTNTAVFPDNSRSAPSRYPVGILI